MDDILDKKKEEGIDTESIDDILNKEFEDDVGGGSIQELEEEGTEIGETAAVNDESDKELEEELGADIAEIEEPEKVAEGTKKGDDDDDDIGDLFSDEKKEESVPKQKKAVKQKKKVDDDIESLIGKSKTPEKPKPSVEIDIGLDEGSNLSFGAKEVEKGVDNKTDKEFEDDFFKEPEKILLYASTKIGKTHAIASLIEAKLKENPNTKFYAIVTDAGFWKTVLRYWRLRKLKIDVLKTHVVYKPVLDLSEIFSVLTEIRSQANPDDWIIIDVLSDFWDRAQDKFIDKCCEITGGDMVEWIVQASQDDNKFGLLDGFQWGYCKRLDSTISYYGIMNSPCNVIASASEKQVGGMAEAIAGEEKVKKAIPMYDSYKRVGFRPDGQKRLPTKFDDIVFLNKTDDGKHFFVIIGSRDIDTEFKNKPYGVSFWEAFNTYKKSKMI